MKTFCVKQRKMTECIQGSEQYVKTKNGRNAMKCKCAECGIIKFSICIKPTGRWDSISYKKFKK